MVQRELTGQGVYLGRQGDDADIQVYVDLTDWLEEYGAGYGVMLFTSPDGKTWPLYTEVDADGKKMTGEITQTETARFGNGVIEARWMAGGTMMASEKYNAYILPQAFKGEVPRHITPSWVQDLILGFESSRGLIDEAREVAREAAEALEGVDEAKEAARAADMSAESAGISAQEAAQSAEDVKAEAQNAEAWAQGTREGAAVPSSDAAYNKHAKHWADQAAASASAAMQGTPEGYASIVSHIAGEFDPTAAYAAGAYVWHEAKLYRFTADHAAGEWLGTDAEEVQMSESIQDMHAYDAERDKIVRLDARIALSVKTGGTSKYILYNTGNASNGTTAAYNYTDYIDISKYKQISYKRTGTTSDQSSAGMAFYDAEKTYISGIRTLLSQESTGYASDLYTAEVPENAVYARFTMFADTDTYGVFEAYGINVIGSKIEDIEGDIESIKNDIYVYTEEPLTWVQGSWINNGNGNSQQQSIKTSAFQMARGKITIPEGFGVCLGAWYLRSPLSASNFIGNIVGSYQNPADTREVIIPENDGYFFRITIRRLPMTTDALPLDAGENVHAYHRHTIDESKADTETVNDALAKKLNLPSSGYGTPGKVLKSSGTSVPVWADDEKLSPDGLQDAVNDWFARNPQSYSTVQDRSITEAKMHKTALSYITPEMFGAVGDGVTPDDNALQAAIDYAMQNNIILDGRGKKYALSGANLVPWATDDLPLRGLYIYNGSCTIQNIRLTLIDAATRGTSVLQVNVRSGDRVIIRDVDIDGNGTNQASDVRGDGNMSGIKIGRSGDQGNVLVENCHIRNCYTDCMTAGHKAFDSFIVRNCLFEEAGRNGFTDNALNSVVENCTFRNNGVRTAPHGQYYIEPDSAGVFTNKVIRNCRMIAGESTTSDFLCLLKYTGTMRNLIVDGCVFNNALIQANPASENSVCVYDHVVFQNCSMDLIRCGHNAASLEQVENNDLRVVNCDVKQINVEFGNTAIIGCHSGTGSMILKGDTLIMANNLIERPEASSMTPQYTNAVITGNVLINEAIIDTSITNKVIENNIVN